MNPTRSIPLSRRGVLAASGTAALLGTFRSTAPAYACDLAPEAIAASSPVASQEGGDRVTLLLVQTFASGSWAPQPNATDVFTLTLTGHVDQTVWFSDRPTRLTGSLPTQELLAGPLFDPDDPPNAALVIGGAPGEEEVVVVELTNPAYDAAAATLTYDAMPLSEGGHGDLAGLAAQQQDAEVPASFGPGALFIDDIWCILDPRRK